MILFCWSGFHEVINPPLVLSHDKKLKSKAFIIEYIRRVFVMNQNIIAFLKLSKKNA